MTGTFNVTRKENALNPYGPRFYLLHRDNIQKQLREYQEQRGCLNPGHLNRFRLLATEGQNKLIAFQGRETTWHDREKSSQ